MRIGCRVCRETTPGKMNLGIVQGKNDGCGARAIPGCATVLRTAFYHAPGMIQGFLRQSPGIGLHVLAMSGHEIRHRGLHRNAGDRRKEHQQRQQYGDNFKLTSIHGRAYSEQFLYRLNTAAGCIRCRKSNRSPPLDKNLSDRFTPTACMKRNSESPDPTVATATVGIRDPR